MNTKDLIEATANNELVRFLGVEIKESAADRVVLTMEVTPKVHQYMGIMNGGVSVYLCETAASIGAVSSIDPNEASPVGIEINANHLRAVSKGVVTVTASPIYQGRTMSVWGIEITNDGGKLVCISRCSVLLRRNSAAGRERLSDG